jgi:hypothetical protein
MEAKHKAIESVTFSVVPAQSVPKGETHAYLTGTIEFIFGFVPAFTIIGDHKVDIKDNNTLVQFIT